MRAFTLLTTAVLTCLLLSGCASRLQRANEQEVIYYKVGTNVIDVFNTSLLWASTEDINYLEQRDVTYGEFGGSIRFCSNKKFHCLLGGLSVVVPKREPSEESWRLHDIKCILNSSVDKEHEVTCKRNTLWTTFIYSEGNGIVQYVRSGDPDTRYILLGTKGLFASRATEPR